MRENSKAPACPVEARLSNISMDVNRRGCFRWTSDAEDLDQSLLDDIHKEFTERASRGDRAIFDFASDYSDKFCHSAQAVVMGLMSAAAPSMEVWNKDKDPPLALWCRASRRALLDVMENEVAPEWIRTEYARLHQENVEMREDWGMDESL